MRNQFQQLAPQRLNRIGGRGLLALTFALSVVVSAGVAQLRLHDIPEPLHRQLDVGADEEVTFVQLSAEPFSYRDAVRFSNGKEILLPKLEEGQRVDVLCLSFDTEPAAVASFSQ